MSINMTEDTDNTLDPRILSPRTYRQMTTAKGAIKDKDGYREFTDDFVDMTKKRNRDLEKQRTIDDSW